MADRGFFVFVLQEYVAGRTQANICDSEISMRNKSGWYRAEAPLACYEGQDFCFLHITGRNNYEIFKDSENNRCRYDYCSGGSRHDRLWKQRGSCFWQQ